MDGQTIVLAVAVIVLAFASYQLYKYNKDHKHHH